MLIKRLLDEIERITDDLRPTRRHSRIQVDLRDLRRNSSVGKSDHASTIFYKIREIFCNFVDIELPMSTAIVSTSEDSISIDIIELS